MRAAPLTFLLILLAGCVEPACLNCDDLNPCTADACVNNKCAHSPLSGPVEGCFGRGGCIEYGCFSGQCLPQRIVKCCGNGVCDSDETQLTCPRDCKATCFDGAQNQGEEGIDCGGPCQRCESQELNYLRKLGVIRNQWYDSAENYTNAIRRYNLDKRLPQLKAASMTAYGEIEVSRALLLNATTPDRYGGGYARLKYMMNDTMKVYLEAVHNMVLFTHSSDDRSRIGSNRLLSDSLELDKAFVREYNGMVSRFNTIQALCTNYQLDAGEESVDCGGICDDGCTETLNVTKYVLLRVERGPTSLVLNVSSPAIEYPPWQTIVASYFEPKPTRVARTPEGNVYYVYDLRMPAYGTREVEVTNTVRLQRMPRPAKSASDYFSSLYVIENEMSPTSDDICYRANILKDGSKNNSQTAERIFDWMVKNIRYDANNVEYGAQYCYINRRGACDEHADLFVSMARCVGIPARRVTGSLVNGTQLNGHAWAEYYDGGWVYIDPSVKRLNQAYVPDNKHVTACVGEGAYHCGTGYTYTYTGARPKITIEEQVYGG